MTKPAPRTPRKTQSLRKPRATARRKPIARAGTEAESRAIALAAHLRSKGTDDIVLLSVAALSDYTDYLIIATGASSTTVRALANYALQWAEQAKLKPVGIEGLDQPDWVLLDLGSIVVHLFVPEARQYYAIETLWLDAARIDVALPERARA